MRSLALVILLIPVIGTCAEHRLWYRSPANTESEWNKALPIGNGRLGGMVFGDPYHERIQLNEDTIWAGPPVPAQPDGSAEAIRLARSLWFEKKYSEAEQAVRAALGQRIAPRSYQPLGDLWLRMPGYEKGSRSAVYIRELDLSTGIVRTQFRHAGGVVVRSVFASRPGNVVIVHYDTSQEGSLDLDIDLTRQSGAITQRLDNGLSLVGQASHGDQHLGVKFAAIAQVTASGEGATVVGGQVRGATEIVITLTCRTDYNRDQPYTPKTHDLLAEANEDQASLRKQSIDEMMKEAVTAHQQQYNRFELQLSGESHADEATDDRLDAVKSGATDVGLHSLLAHYARYLLIACSQPGDQPANLQGLWNPHMEAPWNADYHTNINLQMNYWPAWPLNLADLHEPFFKHVNVVANTGGRSTAQKLGTRGFLLPTESDVWGYAALTGQPVWGMWVMGGPWCSAHFMEHFRFTRDGAFLRREAWPILKESAEFLLDWLVENPETGYLVSGPTTSPENTYLVDGKRLSVSMGPTMDQMIAYETFSNVLEAAELLSIRDDFVDAVKLARRRLQTPQIGENGLIMEWALPFEEAEPGHRHMSHLYGLHPGAQMVPYSPEWIAAEKSLNDRVSKGGGHTGWSRAWMINFRARLFDSDSAYRNLQLLLQKSMYPNLFDDHPPFQIDGNFGAASGIAEMLLQSHEISEGAIVLRVMPAVPIEWGNVNVRGLRARGAATVDIRYDEAKKAHVVTVIPDRAGTRFRLAVGASENFMELESVRAGRPQTVTLSSIERRAFGSSSVAN
ncbi:glycoside hydrolase family 95 protein [Kamptonema cortianum]|nr:glycoside hydrolase family 95 protein [Geitlerinema splendidum]MDK3155993.1 glycoside hydrolase family 95 protein [Kamptonema cortianum]